MRLQLPSHGLKPEELNLLKGLLGQHPGDSEVFLHLGATKVLKLADDFTVDTRNGLVAELRVLLGPDSVIV